MIVMSEPKVTPTKPTGSVEDAMDYVSPEAKEYNETIRLIGWDEDVIHGALNGFHHGFKAGHASRDSEVQSLQTKLDVAMGALESAHDHFVDHYNKAPCPHCKFGYEECKDALSKINEEKMG